MKNVFIPKDGSVDVAFDPAILLASLGTRINGSVPDLGVYLRSTAAQTHLNIPDAMGDRITSGLREFLATGESEPIPLTLENHSLFHDIVLPREIDFFQIYHWPKDATLRGQALKDRIGDSIQLSNDNWKWLYAPDKDQLIHLDQQSKLFENRLLLRLMTQHTLG